MPRHHRVGRVLSVSPVVGIGTPPPLLPQASVPPHPLVGGGGHTRLRLKGWGSPNSNEGTDTVVLYIYKYFVPATMHCKTVVCTLHALPSFTQSVASAPYIRMF